MQSPLSFLVAILRIHFTPFHSSLFFFPLLSILLIVVSSLSTFRLLSLLSLRMLDSALRMYRCCTVSYSFVPIKSA